MSEERFDRAFREHGRRIYAYCLVRTGSPADAEDLTAETFARFIERGSSVPDERVLPWLYRVAHNACVDHARKARAGEGPHGGERGSSLAPAAADPAADPDPALSALEDAALVWPAVRELTPPQQRVVYLRVVEDLPFAQVARQLRKREGAVKMAYYRAIEQLGKTLGSEQR